MKAGCVHGSTDELGYDVAGWHLFADAQLRWARFRYLGDIDLGSVSWTFFNPKAGVRLDLSDRASAYLSVGRTEREPARSDILLGEDNFDVDIAVEGDAIGLAHALAETLGGPVVVKAQVLTGGRGKAGGVKLATSAEQVRLHSENIIGLDIKGHVVGRLWIEKASDIAREYYLGLILDRSAKAITVIASAEATGFWSRKYELSTPAGSSART